MTNRRTIFAVKLRASNRMRDLWFLAAIVGAVLLVIAMVGAAQVALCYSEHLTWTVKQCLMP